MIPEGFWGDLFPDEAWSAVIAAPEYGLIVLLILALLAAFLWAVPPWRGGR